MTLSSLIQPRVSLKSWIRNRGKGQSEAVYYALVTEGYELLRKHVSLGVQVVSPLLLGHKLELLKLGIRAMRLNENAQEVLTALQKVGRGFDSLESAWKVFHNTHLHNLELKANEIDGAYKKLQKEFHRISNDFSSDGAIQNAAPALPNLGSE
jgi:DNA recombination protein RmuC